MLKGKIPGFKQRMARDTENAGLADVGLMQPFIEDVCRRAAQAVAQRKQIDVIHANAKGC